MTGFTYNDFARELFNGLFRNAFYIGRRQIYDDKSGKGPHKIYYVGYHDLFGVRMPGPRGLIEVQLWGASWVMGKDDKLDVAIENAMHGEFPNVRHNVQLRKRAKSRGRLFIKPQWFDPTKAPAAKEANSKLPIRGRKRRNGKRKRRRLLI